ncbi:hypothetical protein V7S43_015645 [Phytophthora oleae]|uniref:Uncharacterized protein n=1 Tax=Phytophthora oleae TaxID=2107226 RepID=A0ABD3F2K9_9STRA
MVPPLLSVTLVFRPRPEFDGMADIISSVSAYADSSVEQPLHKACKFGSVALLDRIWSSTADLEPSGWGLWSVRKLLRTHKLYGKLQFTLCLLEAAKINSVDIARWLFERFPYGVRRKVICEAAKAGALEILQFFRANGTTIRNEAEQQDEDEEWDEEKENWERGRYIRFGGLDAAEAALAGHDDVVKWLYATYKETEERRNDDSAMRAAFSVGNVELAEWIMAEVGFEVQGYLALHKAAGAGLVETLQWFQDKGTYTECDAGALILAAEDGQLKVVQWMLDRDRKDDKLKNGDVAGPEYGHRARSTFITCLGGEASLAIHSAAVNGHLEVAKLLHANIDKPRNQAEKEAEKRRRRKRIHELSNYFDLGFRPRDVVREVSGETMMLAAERGFLDVVKWLYTEYHADPSMALFWVRGQVDEYGYSEKIDAYSDVQSVFCSVVDAAAGNGHLEIVRYLLHVGGGKAEDERAPKRQRTDTYPELRDCYKMPGRAEQR